MCSLTKKPGHSPTLDEIIVTDNEINPAHTEIDYAGNEIDSTGAEINSTGRETKPPGGEIDYADSESKSTIGEILQFFKVWSVVIYQLFSLREAVWSEARLKDKFRYILSAFFEIILYQSNLIFFDKPPISFLKAVHFS